MKVRGGFVSNSSSSSFIVVFERMPESVGEMKRAVFGDHDGMLKHPYYDEHYSYDRVAQTLFEDMRGPLTLEEIVNMIAGSYFDGMPASGDFELPARDESYPRVDWEAFDKANTIAAEDAAQRMIRESEGKVLLGFTFGDEDGTYYGALEHGDVFGSLSHMTLNNH